jgi:quercetin dioxygenase-like cupin family protein
LLKSASARKTEKHRKSNNLVLAKLFRERYLITTVATLNDFPTFMKNPENRVENKDQYSKDIEGYYYQGNDGSQIAFWTCGTAGTSATHTHPFDEYIVCIQGKYTVLIDGEEIDLRPGDEYLIPNGTKHSCKRIAKTRTIHAFGGKRIQKSQ